MEAITLSHVRIPSINIGGICLPGIGAPGSIGKKGLIWPTGMKEHIKAWYDPKKQGMTNYDVIESYAEDFTYWTLDNTGITSTPKKIVIPAGTELKYIIAFRGFNSFTDGFHIKYTGNAVITYRYNKEDGTVGTIAINESGIYHLPASVRTQKNFGFYCNPQTVTEETTIEQLPTSILKDLSGNGNHAYLYGGKGKLNSGMGVYKFDFLSDLLINSAYLPYTERQYDSICSLAGHPNGWLFQYKSLTDIPTFKIEVKGIVNDKFHYRWYDENGNRGVDFVIDKDGIYEFPMSYSVETNTGVGIVCNNICQDNVCFTQIPDYPNQLCYDGKMYAVCYGFPILTDYTVMAERTWFENNGNRVFITKGNIWPNCAFVFEKINASLDSETFSFSKSTRIDDLRSKSGVTYQTKQSYNGVPIAVGDSSDGDVLLIGGQKSGEYIGCHSAIIVADRSFTEEEINWLKQNWDKI
ncbi:hypothetical protein [Bacteroides clarus]|uniref:hypothetical protein n=1 Tax=Bacteroides clarus TaxID=626929 RepID=UPI002431E6CB|nr:hypothetical protein [Bacteroides clarus]